MKRFEEQMFLIYTIKEGGEYNVLQDFTQEQFKQLVKNKYFELKYGDREPDKIYPAFATIVQGIDNFDFLLNEKGERI